MANIKKVFDQIFDEVFVDRKIQCTVLPGQGIQYTGLLGKDMQRTVLLCQKKHPLTIHIIGRPTGETGFPPTIADIATLQLFLKRLVARGR